MHQNSANIFCFFDLFLSLSLCCWWILCVAVILYSVTYKISLKWDQYRQNVSGFLFCVRFCCSARSTRRYVVSLPAAARPMSEKSPIPSIAAVAAAAAATQRMLLYYTHAHMAALCSYTIGNWSWFRIKKFIAFTSDVFVSIFLINVCVYVRECGAASRLADLWTKKRKYNANEWCGRIFCRSERHKSPSSINHYLSNWVKTNDEIHSKVRLRKDDKKGQIQTKWLVQFHIAGIRIKAITRCFHYRNETTAPWTGKWKKKNNHRSGLVQSQSCSASVRPCLINCTKPTACFCMLISFLFLFHSTVICATRRMRVIHIKYN